VSPEQTRHFQQVANASSARPGKRAIRFVWLNGRCNIQPLPAQPIVLKDGGPFRLPFRFKGPEGVTVSSSMLIRNAQKPQMDYNHSKAAKASAEWRQIAFDFDAPPEATQFCIYLRVSGDGVLFDDVSLTRVTK